MEKRNNFDHSIMTSSGVHKEYFLELSSHSEIIASCIIKKLISYTISEVMSKERINLIPRYCIDYSFKVLNDLFKSKYICYEQDEHKYKKIEERLQFDRPFTGINDWSSNIEPVKLKLIRQAVQLREIQEH